MKDNRYRRKKLDLKYMLFGLALILFGVFSSPFYGYDGSDIYLRVIEYVGLCTPPIGLVICIIGLFTGE